MCVGVRVCGYTHTYCTFTFIPVTYFFYFGIFFTCAAVLCLGGRYPRSPDADWLFFCGFPGRRSSFSRFLVAASTRFSQVDSFLREWEESVSFLVGLLLRKCRLGGAARSHFHHNSHIQIKQASLLVWVSHSEKTIEGTRSHFEGTKSYLCLTDSLRRDRL